jgi:uncharacterized membrane protein
MPESVAVPLRALPWPTLAGSLTVATVMAQLSSPFLAPEDLNASTIVIVLLFVAASLAHAAATGGRHTAVRVLAVAGGLALAVEALGVTTGYPFGAYEYTGTLGPTLVGVPVLIPLAWTMMAYPCLLAGRRLAAVAARRMGPARAATAVLGGTMLTSWDLYLDPQMVAAGHWLWEHPSPALPGVPGIPLTNYAGWFVVAVAMVAALDRAVPARTASGDEMVPVVLLTWTWLGSAASNVMFFGRPAVAAYGMVVMGLTMVPYLWLVRDDVRRAAR